MVKTMATVTAEQMIAPMAQNKVKRCSISLNALLA